GGGSGRARRHGGGGDRGVRAGGQGGAGGRRDGDEPVDPRGASRRLGLARAVKFEAQLDGEVIPVEVTGGGGRYRVLLGEETLDVDARPTGGGGWALLVGDVSTPADVMEEDGAYRVHVEGEAYAIRAAEETRHILRNPPA